MKNLYLIILLATLLTSCQSKGEKGNITISNLTHQVLLDDSYLIGRPREMALMNDSIPILLNNPKSKKVLHVLDYANQRAFEVGDIGQGPDEFLFPSSLSIKGNTVSLFDLNKNRYSSIRLSLEDSTIQVSHRFKTNDSLLHIQILPTSNHNYLATGFYQHNRFTLLDENGKCLKGMEEIFASDEEDRKMPGMARSQVYQGEMAINPSKTQMVQAMGGADVFSFYNINANGDLTLFKEEARSFPEYNADGAVNASSFIVHYLDICATNRYVYMLHSGRKFSESIEKAEKSNVVHVYDWKGNKVKEWHLDVDIVRMCVTEDDSRMYAIAFHPDPILVSFEAK